MEKLTKKTILVLGTARSGTTWLANLLAKPRRYRLLFEPFHTDHLEKAPLIADRYWGNTPSQETISFCHTALTDRIDSDWIRQNISKKYFFRKLRQWPKVIIVKDIRSNLFIPTYQSLYGNSIKILVIIRNPYDVVESLSRAKFPWTLDISVLLAQKTFFQKYNVPIERLRHYCDTKIGIYTVRWIIENYFLLNNRYSPDIEVQYYENILKNSVSNVQQICKNLGLKPSPYLQQTISVPSYTTHTDSHLKKKSSRKNRLSEENFKLVEEILETAGINYPATDT